jgi:hypothetical protein
LIENSNFTLLDWLLCTRISRFSSSSCDLQVFGSAFETDGLVAFTWSTAPKESSAGKGLAYEALPHFPSEASESHITGSQAYSNTATDSLSSTGLTSAVTSSLHTSDDLRPLLEKLLAAREEALRFGEPRFGRVEMRFDLGTQLFYQPKGNSASFLSGDPMPLEFVKKAKVNSQLSVSFVGSFLCGWVEELCTKCFRIRGS